MLAVHSSQKNSTSKDHWTLNYLYPHAFLKSNL